MALNCISTLLLFAVLPTFGKYVYQEIYQTWETAQKCCQQDYTDLAPVSGEYDINLIRQLGINSADCVWIGLWRNGTDSSNWLWSGGGKVVTLFWDEHEFEDCDACNYGALVNNTWVDKTTFEEAHYVCYQVHAERERKTWEEALEHCRNNHKDLASVASETEMMLMRKELSKGGEITEHVWVGLRYLGDGWVWIDGQPPGYDAWGPSEEPQCPANRCGALKAWFLAGGSDSGHLESRSVQTPLTPLHSRPDRSITDLLPAAETSQPDHVKSSQEVLQKIKTFLSV